MHCRIHCVERVSRKKEWTKLEGMVVPRLCTAYRFNNFAMEIAIKTKVEFARNNQNSLKQEIERHDGQQSETPEAEKILH